jgi:hypothetical protein
LSCGEGEGAHVMIKLLCVLGAAVSVFVALGVSVVVYYFILPWWLRNGLRGLVCYLFHRKHHTVSVEHGIGRYDTPTTKRYICCDRCGGRWDAGFPL